MQRFRFQLLILLSLLSAVPAHGAATAFDDWPSFYSAFSMWRLDSTRVADVQSLMIERDAGTIVLEEGRLALAMPLGGRRVAAVFTGRGTFLFTPRSEIERQQLRRFYDVTTLRRPFQQLTLIFADSTLAELTSALHFRTDTLGLLRRAWLSTFPYLTARGLHYARPLHLVQMLLDGDDNGLFWSLISDRKSEQPVFFSLMPVFTERVQLARRPEDDRAGLVRWYNAETVCQFFAAGDPDTLRHDLNPAYEATHYAIDLNLASDLRSTATADLTIEARGRARAWLALELPDLLTIDEITVGGRPQKYYEEKENPIVWVRLDQPIEPGTPATLRVRYHGDMFEREDDWVYHRYTTSWYPKPWLGADATWDMTFHYGREIQLVAAGERVALDASGPRHTATWRVTTPVPWASFDVNFLRGTKVVSDSLPPLTVWMRHIDGAGKLTEETLRSMQDAKDYDHRVARDVARAFQFFTLQLGHAQAPSFNVVETPLWVYEGYPGLVHMMMREDKLLPGPEYTPDVIRAHEISHQWFGLGVRPATYHDAWLSEGFADFCSIWYLQAARRDTHNYLDVLDAWRTKLLENRKFLLGGGQQAGPIWLGPRTNSSSTPNDYDLVVYAKGAWVLHMLRNYLLEPDDPSESRFRGLMRDFYQRYNGRRAFTEDFRAAAERAAGEDLGWFFEQWVYGTDVPTCRFTWKTVQVGNQWKVVGHVEQTGVPATFRMPVLVRVNFGRDRYSRERVWVTGPSTDFELPLAPARPTEVVFNDLQSVLCEVTK
jgi:hypothetical protein